MDPSFRWEGQQGR
jgi:SRSO17 transposase